MSVGTINGFGTMWIESKDGGTELRAATMWAVALFLPILPLERAVLEPVGDDEEGVFKSSRSYYVHESIPISPLDCLFTLLWRWLILGPAKIFQFIWLPALMVCLGTRTGLIPDVFEDIPKFTKAVRWWHGAGLIAGALLGFAVFEPVIGCLTRFEKAVLSRFDPLNAVSTHGAS